PRPGPAPRAGPRRAPPGRPGRRACRVFLTWVPSPCLPRGPSPVPLGGSAPAGAERGEAAAGAGADDRRRAAAGGPAAQAGRPPAARAADGAGEGVVVRVVEERRAVARGQGLRLRRRQGAGLLGVLQFRLELLELAEDLERRARDGVVADGGVRARV